MQRNTFKPLTVGKTIPERMAAITSEFKNGLELPEPFARIERYPLLLGPSPIYSLPRISAALGDKVAIYAKREDVDSAIAFGGNKTRKLEYLVSEALAQHCDTLVSIGSFRSNRTLAWRPNWA
jgi:hypothetical protein